MTQINEIIVREISDLTNVSMEMKHFLAWIVEFEKNNEDKEQYNYKSDIENKLQELLILSKE